MRCSSVFLCAIWSLLFLGDSKLNAQLRLPALFGDNMVLQRGIEPRIWGWAAPGEDVSVSVSWADSVITTQTDETGRWLVHLPQADAGGPYTIQITSEQTITLTNVMIGEVWICSGQSNMQWPMARTDNAATQIAAADYPDIRLFNVAKAVALSPRDDCSGAWAECSPASVAEFSAVGYYFGRELNQELDVPIGLIAANWGGTRVEAWTTQNTLRNYSELHEELDQLAAMRSNTELIERVLQSAQDQWWENLTAKDAIAGDQHQRDPDFDDSGWPTVSLPGVWEQSRLGEFDGVVWFRKSFELPDDLTGQTLMLELGPIDDMDTTYVNGHRVGGFEAPGDWQTHRRFLVRAPSLHQGTNTIAVRVVDTGGAGGFSGSAHMMTLGRPDTTGPTVDLAGDWKYHTGPTMRELGGWPSLRPLHSNSAAALYNGMIAPLQPYGIRGAIWYQGESNRMNAYAYRARFAAMIQDWRTAWGQGQFPFYFVQIAPFNYAQDQGQAAELREAQLMTMAVPNTGMAVTMDIGNPRDVHPTNKLDVGKRLARWALAKDYAKNTAFSGPLYESMTITGSKAHLLFKDADKGLVCRGDELTHFTIAGEDQKFVTAHAYIEGDSIIVSAVGVDKPVAVRFAWGAADEPNLFNIAGLPASSFRTDRWPGLTEPQTSQE